YPSTIYITLVKTIIASNSSLCSSIGPSINPLPRGHSVVTVDLETASRSSCTSLPSPPRIDEVEAELLW
ncbi:hypothetical protein ACJX0J_008910, partial [Zea mays]